MTLGLQVGGPPRSPVSIGAIIAPMAPIPTILTPAWCIECTDSRPVARFAAEELRRTLHRIGGPALPLHTHAPGLRIALRAGPTGDGFLRRADAHGVVLQGDGPCGLLYAVYDLLEALGCRWVAPGVFGERLPHYEHVELPAGAVARHPALAGRGLILGHDFFLDTAEEWIVWAARNGLNRLFVHTTPVRPALWACRLAAWRKRRADLLPLLEARGMVLELGGHGLSRLVPRHLFRDYPAAFRFDGRQRTPDYNFCPHNLFALAQLQTHGAAFFRTFPEASVYHLWPDDLTGGGWCHCAACSALSASDQALLAINALAETLTRINPAARIAHLAYHDTQPAPQRVAPHPAVQLLFAPRRRSYAVGVLEPTSAVNQPMIADLAANQHHFGAAAIFEYYLDGILFKSAPPPLLTTLQADMRAYRDLGVATVHALMTGDRPWVAPPPSAYLFARLAWEPEQAPTALLATYAEAIAPRTPAALVLAYTALDQAWQPALDHQPGEAGGSAATSPDVRGMRSLFDNPSTDVLDMMLAPRVMREQRLEALGTLESALRTGEASVQDLVTHAHADAPRIEPLVAEWHLAAAWLRFTLARQRLFVLEARNANRTVLHMQLREARQALDQLEAWGAAQLPPGRAQGNFMLLRQRERIGLDAFAVRNLAWVGAQWGLKLRAYATLARLALRLWRWL